MLSSKEACNINNKSVKIQRKWPQSHLLWHKGASKQDQSENHVALRFDFLYWWYLLKMSTSLSFFSSFVSCFVFTKFLIMLNKNWNFVCRISWFLWPSVYLRFWKMNQKYVNLNNYTWNYTYFVKKKSPVIFNFGEML